MPAPQVDVPEEVSNEELLQQFEELHTNKIIDYVLPTTELGKEWIVGVDGTIVKLIGKDQACAFLAGASAVIRALARKYHITI